MVCRGNIPEEDAEVEQCFLDVCARLGIEGRVELCRNDLVEIPCMTYYHGPVVILPYRKYMRQQAEVIFYHELCHYKEGDVHLKTWGVLVSQLHVFNPAVHILLDQIDLICEKCCDRMACEKGKDAFTTKEYFEIIKRMILTDGKKERYQLFSLVDTKSNYERRIEYMKKYQEQGCLRKGTALLLSVCFLLGSSMTALAAGDGLADAYVGMTEDTESMTTDSIIDTADFEEICSAYDLDPDTVVMMDDGIQARGRTITLRWYVPAGRTYMSSGFNKLEESEVTVAVAADPEDITYRTGIKDPNELMRYVEGEGTITHTFEIEIAGRYYFFVKNMSETEELYVEAFIVK
jgi:hypothetical protein